jgi:hypothetical protein
MAESAARTTLGKVANKQSALTPQTETQPPSTDDARMPYN